MSIAAKKKIVYACLVLLTLWPAVHISLAKRYEMSPWKLAGWGMYAEPRFGLVGMEVYFREAGREDFSQLVSPAPELRPVASAFLERRRWLRELASPDGFARATLARYPEFEELKVTIFRPVLDRETGMVVMSQSEYPYRR